MIWSYFWQQLTWTVCCIQVHYIEQFLNTFFFFIVLGVVTGVSGSVWCLRSLQAKIIHFCLLWLGRTSLSLALGNMAVARQILLIFNLSYLPCFVQFVNKNYCQAKNDLFTTCWCHYFVREWCIVSLEEVLMNTPSGRKPSVVLTSKVRWARSENGCVRKTVGNFYKKNVHIWS